MGSVAIQTLGWANAHITGNLIDSVPRAIAVYTAAASGTCLSGDMAAEGDTVQHFSHDMETHWANVFIENNTITNCATVTDNYSSYERAAISVMGSNITSGALPQGVHQCINAAVRHNYISAKGNGIRVEYAKNIVVEGNVISSLGTSNNNDYGIVMRHNVSNAYINKNYIQNIPVNGIQLDTCSVKEIHSNDIMTTGKYGMGFYAATIDSIVNNEIRDTANRGILLSIGSSVTNRIAENRFLRTGSTAVKIDNDGSAAKLALRRGDHPETQRKLPRRQICFSAQLALSLYLSILRHQCSHCHCGRTDHGAPTRHSDRNRQCRKHSKCRKTDRHGQRHRRKARSLSRRY